MVNTCTSPRNLGPLPEVISQILMLAQPIYEGASLPPSVFQLPGFILLHISSILPPTTPLPSSTTIDKLSHVIHLDTEDEEVLAIMINMDIDIGPEPPILPQPPQQGDRINTITKVSMAIRHIVELSEAHEALLQLVSRSSLCTMMQGQAWLVNVEPTHGSVQNLCTVTDSLLCPHLHDVPCNSNLLIARLHCSELLSPFKAVSSSTMSQMRSLRKLQKVKTPSKTRRRHNSCPRALATYHQLTP